MPEPYDHDFYEDQRAGSSSSARAMMPAVVDLLRPDSILDVGCGIGTWLEAAHKAGVADFLGIDGAYVARADLAIPVENFQAMDLTRPTRLSRQFDLVMSLEVAEHLNEEHAHTFVDFLVSCGEIVLFSAAVPRQGGTHHVNERWPSWWAEIFAAFDRVPVDPFRSAFWSDPRVVYHYAQNMLLYVPRSHPLALRDFNTLPLDVVHPHLYEARSRSPEDFRVLEQLKALSRSLPSAVSRRLTGKPDSS